MLVVVKRSVGTAYRILRHGTDRLRNNPEERRSLSVSVIKTNQLKLCRELITVGNDFLIKYNYSSCGRTVEIFNVKHGGT
jgi:hypothetical protein